MTDILNDIKTKISLDQYIGRDVSLKRAGRLLKACCPFHNEKTPSFVVNLEKNSWRCYGACHDGGDLFTYAMKRHGWTFIEAKEALAKEAGVEIPRYENANDQQHERMYTILKLVSDFYFDYLRGPQGQAARDLLAKRGVTMAEADNWRIGLAPVQPGLLRAYLHELTVSDEQGIEVGVLVRDENGTVHERMRGRIMLPIRDGRGRVIAFGGRSPHPDLMPKYLNTPTTPLFAKSNNLYGMDKAQTLWNRGKPAVVVEGYFDVIAAHRHGSAAVAPLGSALTEGHAKLLKKATSVILAMDGDSAGEVAASRAVQTMLEGGANPMVAYLPPGVDPDEMEASAWAETLEHAIPGHKAAITASLRALPVNATPKDKAEAIRTLAGLFAATNDDLQQQVMADDIARAFQIPERLVYAEVKPVNKKRPVRAEPSAPLPTMNSGEVVERLLLRHLLHVPQDLYGLQRAMRLSGGGPLAVEHFVYFPAYFALVLESLDQDEIEFAEYIRPHLPAWALKVSLQTLQLGDLAFWLRDENPTLRSSQMNDETDPAMMEPA